MSLQSTEKGHLHNYETVIGPKSFKTDLRNRIEIVIKMVNSG